MAIPLEAPVVVLDAVPVTDPGAVLAGVSAIGSLPEPTKVLEEAISAIHMSTEMEDGWQIKRNKKNNKRIEPESTVVQSKGNSPMKLSYADAVSRGALPLRVNHNRRRGAQIKDIMMTTLRRMRQNILSMTGYPRTSQRTKVNKHLDIDC